MLLAETSRIGLQSSDLTQRGHPDESPGATSSGTAGAELGALGDAAPDTKFSSLFHLPSRSANPLGAFTLSKKTEPHAGFL